MSIKDELQCLLMPFGGGVVGLLVSITSLIAKKAVQAIQEHKTLSTVDTLLLPLTSNGSPRTLDSDA